MLTKEQTALWEKWIEALESGKYRQGESFLKRSDGSMCCLGVACDLIGDRWIKTTNGFIFDDSGHFVPLDVRNIYGFVARTGFVVNGEQSIASINDSTFNLESPDYSNVLPHIKQYLANNQYKENSNG